MIVGLSTLASLKAHILPASAQSATADDEIIASVARGVSASFERYCNRRLIRREGDQFTAQTPAASISLPWVPLESIHSASLVIRAGTDAETIEDITERIYSIDGPAGILWFEETIAQRGAEIVIEGTGGYWIDPGDGTPLPPGAMPVPDDLLQAWRDQIQSDMQESAALRGRTLTRAGEDDGNLETRLIPRVRETLNLYRRHA